MAIVTFRESARRLSIRLIPRISWRYSIPRFMPPVPIVLAAWCGLLFVYGVATGPLYRTESLRAIIGRECLHGHWLFPVLYGEPFLTKPPGQYVAIGLTALPFREVSAASARIPSILAASIAVFCFYRVARSAFPERTAMLVALLLPTSILWLDKVPSAEIDMTLLGWVTASLVIFERATRPGEKPLFKYYLLSWMCVAGGTLTKWTAPAFFAITIFPWLAWRRELRLLWGWRNLLAAAVAIGLCLLWACAVVQQVGINKLWDTVAQEAAYRFAPKGTGRGYPWASVATYPLLVCAAQLPLAFFAVRTFQPSFWQRCDSDGRRLVQLLHCWAWPNLLFWSLVPNHNVRYALPMSPALMGLGAIGLLDWLALRSQSRVWSFRVLSCYLTTWLVVKLAFVGFVVPERTAHHNAVPIGRILCDHVPEGCTLFVFRQKDEGVMFYYGRPVVRLNHGEELPADSYAVLMGQEWEEWPAQDRCEIRETLHDQQGGLFYLIYQRK